ncbi:MAG: hypothetical protein EWM51_11195 [Treponema sp.]|nr:MAG: hypothetical protein BWY39_00272 [Spirochaetes bacterium ADurb.Bin269]TAH47950.1 MAG: hypothetical protein EWM51_11195 [Treponema sp.]HQL32464.1 hypothetical protein [Treponemataceae bacterium]
MILKKILKGYAAIGASVLRLALLLLVCLAAACIIVFPLWKLADANPGAYTAVCAILCSLLVIMLTASRIRQSYLRDPRRFILSIVRKTVILTGIAVSALLVLQYQRLAAAGILVLTFIGYGYLAFGVQNDTRTKH